MAASKRTERAPTIANTLVAKAFELARMHAIDTLIVQADDHRDIRAVEKTRDSEKILWLTTVADHPLSGLDDELVLPVPAVALKTNSQLQLALLLAVLHHHVELDETVLCLGARDPGRGVDTLIAASPRVDLPWFGSKRRAVEALSAAVSNELARLIAIALRLSGEGREGRPIGTAFVLGGGDELAPYLRQLVLNPCEGHPRRSRNIHADSFFETIREFAALDGAFIVNEKGVVEAAGVYLEAPRKGVRLPQGLGARHSAAAGITAATSAVAVVVSESSGTVTTFHGGRPVLTLEKPA